MISKKRRKRGVIDQAIDAAKPCDGLIDHRLHVGLVRHVGTDEADAEAFFQRGSFVLPARGDDALAPSSTKSSAMPSPMPLVPPVTMATFPSSAPISISLQSD
jgi:hypothetical protein